MDQPFGVKAPYFENEGALHMTRGKFLLSVSGVQKKWETAEKTKKIAIIAAVCVVVLLLAAATFLAGHQPNTMPYQHRLGEMIGQPLETVAAALELETNAFEQVQTGVYRIKDGCKLSGIPFEITLYFGEDAALNSFAYVAEYEAGTNQAASDFYKLSIDFGLKRLAQEQLADMDLSALGIKKQIQNGAFNLQVECNVSPTYTESDVYRYLRQVEGSEEWPGRLGEYVTANAMLYEDIDLRYAPETQTVHVQIAYTVEPDRSK